MSQKFVTSIIILSFFLISGCSGSTSIEGSVQQGTNAPDSALVDLPVIIPSVEFKGELPIARELTVDINQMLQAADYGDPFLEGVARDGSNILIQVQSNSVQTIDNVSSRKSGYIRIDTESGDAKWVFTEVGSETHTFFDENNNAIVMASPVCSEVDFIDLAGESPIIFNNFISNDRCLSKSVISDDGSILVFETYNRNATDLLDIDVKNFVYSLTSSFMHEFPETSIVFEEQLLGPAIPLFSSPGIRPFLSKNGNYVISKQW